MKLAQVEIFCGKMHLTGHMDDRCLANCDPKQFKELDQVRVHMYLVYLMWNFMLYTMLGRHRGL